MTGPPAIAGILLLVLPAAACGGGARAQAPDDRGGRPAAEARVEAEGRRGLGDRDELEAFLDGLVGATLEDQRVAGAVVAVVKADIPFFVKGYGYADVERRTPADPERTLFRIGSVTKLFTATAVMQLVEAGRIDLDTDVNRYLDFQIPETYAEPITLTHLLTHTAGFEDDGRDLWARDSSQLMPVGRWLATHIPERVRPPGIFSAYSNYAIALAGYIVERVSGLPWDDYLEQRILALLGMTRSTGRQPLPARFRDDMSQGYRSFRGGFDSREWELLMGASPAGSMSATATDMATFMQAHLGNGAVDDRRILSEETAARMHARAFGHDPRMPGFALGFYEKSSHGLRIVGHTGNTQWFHAELALVPSEGLGVFVAYNTDTAGAQSLGSLPFLQTFLDHYYPVPPLPVAADAGTVAQARRVAGEYRFNRMSYTTFQKAFALTQAVRVSADVNGSVRLAGALGEMHLFPVEPLLYQEREGSELIAFKAEGPGPATHGFVASIPLMVLERVPWYESARLHGIILGVAVVIFAAVARGALDRLIRRGEGARVADALPGRSLIVGLALANLTFALIVALLMADPVATLTRPRTGLMIALAFPVVSTALTVLAAAAAVRHWTQGRGTRVARIRYGAVVFVSAIFCWSLNQWNLLGWRF